MELNKEEIEYIVSLIDNDDDYPEEYAMDNMEEDDDVEFELLVTKATKFQKDLLKKLNNNTEEEK